MIAPDRSTAAAFARYLTGEVVANSRTASKGVALFARTSRVRAAAVSPGYNLSDDAGCASFFGPSGLATADAKLGPLRDNGAPTYTHALLTDSLAIDTGTNSPLVGRPYDQRGPGLVRDANGRVDIGACEMQQPTATELGVKVAGVCMALQGEPYEELAVEWNTDARGNGWKTLATGTTDANGMLEIIDASPLVPKRLYRTKRP